MTTLPDRPSVLVVDDQASALMYLGSLLDPHYNVLAAQSGEQALELAAGDPTPDLILLDVLMPGMDGYDVFVRLRGDAATRDIPVIFVTGLDSTEAEERGLELGAVDYIAKPYRPPIVLARVHTHIELKRARDRLRDQNAWLEAELSRRLKEIQQVQAQVMQSEKLAAIGLLAAGIAHEINNPVSYVTTNLGTLASYVKDVFELLDAYAALERSHAADAAELVAIRELKRRSDMEVLRADLHELVAESREGLGRVARIVRDLKDFSRAERDDRQWADLHEGIESTLTIVWNEIKYHCTLRKEYGALPKVHCVPSQIDQVVMNLLVNAAQAITDQGEIVIRTGTAGGEAFIAVSDTGSGISAENMSRLFEPFFTTKPAGKGTGLGLSIAYGIVRKHGGRIEVQSEPAHGSTFTVWLPIEPNISATPTSLPP